MNLDIFFDVGYFNKLEEFISIEQIGHIYPFKEMRIDPDNLVTDGYDQTNLYNFLKSVHFFYYYSQSHYGYVKLDGKFYIIEVGDEVNMMILGDNEINWTKFLLDEADYLSFKKFCVYNYGIDYHEANYEEQQKIEKEHMNFWGFL